MQSRTTYSYGGQKKQLSTSSLSSHLLSSSSSSNDLYYTSNSALKKLQKSRKILADSLARPTSSMDAWIPNSMIRAINPKTKSAQTRPATAMGMVKSSRQTPAPPAPPPVHNRPTTAPLSGNGDMAAPGNLGSPMDRYANNSMPMAIQMHKVEYLLNTRSSPNRWSLSGGGGSVEGSESVVSANQVEFPLERVFRTSVVATTASSLAPPKSGSTSSTVLIKDAPPTVYEKLELGRRNLQECPELQDRVFLKYLDLQGNFITRIDNLYTLRNLVFLDFYNNQLERIQGLGELTNLRALMLGRNNISKIEGLSNLCNLDILDLHSNRITEIENLRSLTCLRVLNMEDNLIRELPTLTGLCSLVEVNLRRNKVWAIHENGQCRKLQKIVLTDNQINLLQDMEALFSLESLSELWLEQNKVASLPMFKTMVVSKCQSLKLLNGRRVLEEAKRSALKQVRKEENKKKDLERKADYQQEKRRYIEQIKSDWKKQEDEFAAAATVRSKNKQEQGDLQPYSLKTYTPNPKTAYVELDGSVLRIYGNGSAAINRAESHVASCIIFDHVPITHIVPYCKTLYRFLNLTHLVFSNNGFSKLKQLLPLAVLPNLVNLDVVRERNIVVDSKLFRPFAVFLFPRLELLCNISVSASDRREAEAEFGHLENHIVECKKSRGSGGIAGPPSGLISAAAFLPPDEVELFQKSQIAQDVETSVRKVADRVSKKSRLQALFDSQILLGLTKHHHGLRQSDTGEI